MWRPTVSYNRCIGRFSKVVFFRPWFLTISFAILHIFQHLATTYLIFTLRTFLATFESTFTNTYFRVFAGTNEIIQRSDGKQYVDSSNFRPDHSFPCDMNLSQSACPIFGIVRIVGRTTSEVKSIPNIRVTSKPMKMWSAYRLSKKDLPGNSFRYRDCWIQIPIESL